MCEREEREREREKRARREERQRERDLFRNQLISLSFIFNFTLFFKLQEKLETQGGKVSN